MPLRRSAGARSRGSFAAAARSSSHSVRRVPVAPATGIATSPAPLSASATAPALALAGGEDPDLGGPADRGQRQRHARRRRLGAAVHRDDGALGLVDRGGVREDRRRVPLAAHAEQGDVEGGHRSVVLRAGVPGEQVRVGLRRGLGARRAGAGVGAHRMHPRRVDRQVVEQGLPGPGSRCARGRRAAGTARRPSRTRRAPSRRRRGPGRAPGARAARSRSRRR